MDSRICTHEWEKVNETETVGKNLIGKEVQCYGWDLRCTKCNTDSWMRDNQRTEIENNDYIMSHFI